MTKVQELFLTIISAALNENQNFNIEQYKEIWNELKKTPAYKNDLYLIAKEQALSQLFYDYILTYGLEVLTEKEKREFQNQVITGAIMYYHMANFVCKVLSLAKQEKIHCCILKGVGLGIYYPKEEVRKTGDIDLYIPILKEWEHFCSVLKSHGFQQEKTMADHHSSFFYISHGTRFELEIHKKPINSQEDIKFNKEIDRIFKRFTRTDTCFFSQVKILNGTVPVLPVEENIFYLLLHILQHFLSGGMGLRMLCDWVVIWNYYGKKTDFSIEKYLSLVKQSKIEGFHYMITGLCISFLGLSLQEVPWMKDHMPKKETMDIFLKDIFDGGEFGEQDKARMLIPLGKLGPAIYAKELHRQMQMRFQRAGKIIIFWPFLWLISIIIFLYNNRFLRKTSVKQILESTKKRSKLLEEIRLFQDKK